MSLISTGSISLDSTFNASLDSKLKSNLPGFQNFRNTVGKKRYFAHFHRKQKKGLFQYLNQRVNNSLLNLNKDVPFALQRHKKQKSFEWIKQNSYRIREVSVSSVSMDRLLSSLKQKITWISWLLVIILRFFHS